MMGEADMVQLKEFVKAEQKAKKVFPPGQLAVYSQRGSFASLLRTWQD